MPTRASTVSSARTLQPSAIFEEIESRPPLMRDQAKAKYIGKKVSWAVIFLDGREDQEGKAHLAFHFAPNDIRMVVGDVVLSAYPSLRSMRPGESLRVRGTIRKFSALSVELEIQDLVFAKAAEAAH